MIEKERSESRFRPKKSLGQNFIHDKSIVFEIIDQADFEKSDHILEIGPGFGALTIPLARGVGHITAIEKDSSLVEILQHKLNRAGITNVTLINEDILRFDLTQISSLSEKKIKIIGNLPYNISSPFLEKLIQYRALVSKAVLMFQLELARRLKATPGGKEYGAMTILIQYYASISYLLKVHKEKFTPKPKIDSMVLSFDMEKPHPREAEDESFFKMIVKGAFAHRRKTLINSLKGSIPSIDSDEVRNALEKCSIDPKRRAETLDIDEFLNLTSVLLNQEIR